MEKTKGQYNALSIPFEVNPLAIFKEWYQTAQHSQQELKPDSFVLSTVDEAGRPSSRVLLFKGEAGKNFIFFTNYEGRKAQELNKNPHVSLVFYWPSLGKQIRVEGKAQKISYQASNDYFQSRPRGSRIGAYASPQSSPIPSRDFLVKRVEEVEKKFLEKEIPCPTNWGGFEVVPSKIEFWIDQADRLHDRFQYHFESASNSWKLVRLAP